MTPIEKLEKEIKKERKKKEDEEKYSKLKSELYSLKNRKELAKIEAKRAKYKKAGQVAKKFLKGTGKALARGATALEKARSQEEREQRMELIHGKKNKQKRKKKSTKKTSYYDSPSIVGDMNMFGGGSGEFRIT
jgi:hypothetical protein